MTVLSGPVRVSHVADPLLGVLPARAGRDRRRLGLHHRAPLRRACPRRPAPTAGPGGCARRRRHHERVRPHGSGHRGSRRDRGRRRPAARLGRAGEARRLGPDRGRRRPVCLRRPGGAFRRGHLHRLRQARRHRRLVQHRRPPGDRAARKQWLPAIGVHARVHRWPRPALPTGVLHLAGGSAGSHRHRHRLGVPALPGVLRGGSSALSVRADSTAGALGPGSGAGPSSSPRSRRCSTRTACGAGSRS